MSKRREERQSTRREFLKLAGVGAGAVGATALTAAGPAKAANIEIPNESGYRETDHVKKFYESARF